MIKASRDILTSNNGRLIAGAGACGLVLLLIGAISGLRGFLFNWLAGYYFYFSIASGALFLLLIHHIIGIEWVKPLRRILENVAISTIYLTPLFLPILFGNSLIYDWRNSNLLFNKYVFILASLVCLVGTSFIVLKLRRYSVLQDNSEDWILIKKMKNYSITGLILFAIAMTIAGFYWIMAVEHPWFSGIFGLYQFSAAVQAGLSLIYILTALLSRSDGELKQVLTTVHSKNLLLLIFSFTLIHAYTSYSQYMLILSASLPAETVWYSHRLENGWFALWLCMLFFRLVFPFSLLLWRKFRSDSRLMIVACSLILCGHLIEIYINVMPALNRYSEQPFGSVYQLFGILAFLAAILSLVFLCYMKLNSPYPLIVKRESKLMEEEMDLSPISGGEIFENNRVSEK